MRRSFSQKSFFNNTHNAQTGKDFGLQFKTIKDLQGPAFKTVLKL